MVRGKPPGLGSLPLAVLHTGSGLVQGEHQICCNTCASLSPLVFRDMGRLPKGRLLASGVAPSKGMVAPGRERLLFCGVAFLMREF